MDGSQDGEDFDKLSIEDRLEHKNWKARVSGYEALVKSFRTSVAEDAPEFTPFLRDPARLRAAVLDANVVAQEKGLEAAIAFVEFGGSQAAISHREQLTSALIDKNVFGSARAGTKRGATELCLTLIECADDTSDVVVEACLSGLKSKQPKAVAGAVAAIKEIVKQFGAKTVNVKPILKSLTVIFSHADKTVRAEGTGLVQELHKWLSSGIDPFLAELKPVQIKELNESFVGEAKSCQSRFTRRQQRERARDEAAAALSRNLGASTSNGAADAQGDDFEMASEPEALDAFDLAEPQSVLERLPENFYENTASSKWKERKEMALDPLLDTLKRISRLKEDNYDELLRTLAAHIGDVNIMCAISAAGCIEHLAKGLRIGFGKYKAAVIPPLLERCKEKKQSVVDALSNALDAVFLSLTIGDIIEDVSQFAKHKNPQVKEQAYKWLIRCLQTSTTALSSQADLKPLSDCLLLGLEDSFEPVRSAAAESFGTLVKMIGDRPLSKALEGLDDIRKAKIKEFATNAKVRCATLPKSTTVPSAAGSVNPRATAADKGPRKQFDGNMPLSNRPNKPTINSLLAEKENLPVEGTLKPPAVAAASTGSIRAPPSLANVGAKLPSLSQPVKKTAIVASKATIVPSAPKPHSNEPLKYRYTQEDAEAQASTVIPPETYADLANSNWKVRLAAIDALQIWLAGDGNGVDSEIIVRLLSKHPGWKESNFQVYGKAAATLQKLSKSSESWSRACSALTIGPLTDKFGDVKLKKAVGDTLTAYAERFSLQFVLGHAYEPMTKQKAPKTQAEAMLWVEQSLREFGTVGLAARDLAEFAKTGADVKMFVQDLNPTLLATIDAEFDKVANEKPATPSRISQDNATRSATVSRSKTGKESDDALDDLFPRIDAEKLIPPTLIAACNDANWKARKESLEGIQAVLESNKRLKGTIGELAPALKLRLADSNLVVRGLALDILARLANGLGHAFERYVRLFAPHIMAILSDAKASIRASAVTTLNVVGDNCGTASMFPAVATSLETTNPMQRKELAVWLVDRLTSESPGDCQILIAPTLACLEDRTADVRKAGVALLPHIIRHTSYQAVVDAAGNLKPASRSLVIPLIEASRADVRASASQTETLSETRDADRVRPATPVLIAAKTGSAPDPHLPTNRIGGNRGPSALSRPLRPTAAITTSVGSTANKTSQTPAPANATIGTPDKRRVLQSPSHVSARKAVASSSQRFPFIGGNEEAKIMRAQKDTLSLKWALDSAPRTDQLDLLSAQMATVTDPALLSKLFSTSVHAERDHQDALSLLLDAGNAAVHNADVGQFGIEGSEMRDRLKANADLLLKYLTIRLQDGATATTLKCFDIIDQLLAIILNSNEQLSDCEATAVMPSLVNKVSSSDRYVKSSMSDGILTQLGDAKEPIRQRSRNAIRVMGSIYPSSKIFTALLEYGSCHKNSRCRTETVEELGNLLRRQGISVCQPHKAMPLLASMLADKDAACRSATLGTLAQAHALIGDRLFAYVGDLPDRERSMLDERLRRASPSTSSSPKTQAHAASIVATNNNSSPARLSSRQSALPRANLQAALPRSAQVSRLPSSNVTALPKPRIPSIPSTHVARDITTVRAESQHPSTDRGAYKSATAIGGEDKHDLLRNIQDASPAACVDALKRVQRDISEQADYLVDHASELVDSVTAVIRLAFRGIGARTGDDVLRQCKHLMQTLSSFFDLRKYSLAVGRDALRQLLEELTRCLVDTAEKAAESDAVASLSKVLNMILIRIFHNAQRNHCYGALLKILQDATADLRILQKVEADMQSKYAELVMKCLWKVSKSTRESLEDGSLDAKTLLFDIDAFLQVLPPAEWRRRQTDGIPMGDMPLRTVKTILQQIVSTYGDRVYEQLSHIPRSENSFVYQYLYRLLNNSKTANGASSSDAASSHTLSRQASVMSTVSVAIERQTSNLAAGVLPTRVPASPGQDKEVQLNLALKDIFDQIGNASQSKAGIAELYKFQQTHPEAEARVNTWISATGTHFQSYVRRALSNLAMESSHQGPEKQIQGGTPPKTFASPPLNGARVSEAGPSSAARAVPLSPKDDRLDSLKQMFGASTSHRPTSPSLH